MTGAKVIIDRTVAAFDEPHTRELIDELLKPYDDQPVVVCVVRHGDAIEVEAYGPDDHKPAGFVATRLAVREARR